MTTKFDLKTSKVPFLKWAGGKRKILDKIWSRLPTGERLVEPFCGSATVFLNTNFLNNLIADTNRDVINIYQEIQKDSEGFIQYASRYFKVNNNTAEQYYKLREEFNNTKFNRKRAALFLYLNKHGYNGLCRYNSKGGFNVPFGKYKKVTYPESYLNEFARKTPYADFIVQDFETTIKNSQSGDIIYCDPPYVPLNESNTSFNYDKNGFSFEQQQKLAELAEDAANRGIPVLISNHLTDFTREIYKNAELTEFSVKRYISCKGDNRVAAKEVLALFR